MKENTPKNRLIDKKFSKEIPDGDNRERTVCDNCGMIFYENPKLVAGCLLVWEEKILLCKRATEPRSGFGRCLLGSWKIMRLLKRAH